MLNCLQVIKALEKQGLKPELQYRQEEINVALD